MDDFRELLQKEREEPMLIYGTGWFGQNLAEALRDTFKLVGFSNSYGETRELLGLPVMPLEQVPTSGATVVVIAAKSVTCRSLAPKIGPFCREHGLRLLDAWGYDLLAPVKARYNLLGVEGLSRVELQRKIDAAEVVSFDLFDTLVTRNTLYPSDVYELTELALRERGILINDFPALRRTTEHRMLATAYPRLADIYRELLSGLPPVQITAEELADVEWETDYRLLTPRREMCVVFRAAIAQGKRVYVVTDTWYSEKQIRTILASCGIEDGFELLCSCEFGMGKTQGLFRVLKEREPDARLLHIGDNQTADIRSAELEGIPAAYIHSPLSLLQSAGNLGLPVERSGVSDRIKMGMIAARLFNSPFQFEKENRSLSIGSVYDFGWLYYGPVLTSFTLWFARRVRETSPANIWYSSRDGYLLQKLARLLVPEEGVYLLTSRAAALRAGLHSEEDIRLAERTRFHGTLAEHLWERYGVDIRDYAGKESNAAEGEKDAAGETKDAAGETKGYTATGIDAWREEILATSARARQHYLAYLRTISMKPGITVLFDCVGRGTVQLYLERLVSQHIKGLYIMRLDDSGRENYGDLDIESFYTPEERGSSAMFATYYLLECFLTSPDACVMGFEEDGTPIYRTETRTPEEIRCCLRGQDGIEDFFRTYLSLCPASARSEDKAVDEAMLSNMRAIPVEDETFLNMLRDDPLCNHRETVRELLAEEAPA